MFGRRSAVLGITATLIAGLAGLGVGAATANGNGGAQPVAQRAKLKELTSLQTVDSVSQGKRLAAAAGLRGHTITFITHVIPGRDAFVDVPPADISPGDIFIQEATVFNESHTRRIGKALLHCEINITFPTCNHSIWLKGRGKLLLSDPLLVPGQVGLGAITGGTGRFKDVGGQGTWSDLGPPDFDMLFVMEIVH
jgi:hypothetical protein